jgi:hypothetical protein
MWGGFFLVGEYPIRSVVEAKIAYWEGRKFLSADVDLFFDLMQKQQFFLNQYNRSSMMV